MSTRLLLPRPQAVGLDGRPLAGAKLYTYTTGTTTPKAVYTDAALTVPHANPVIADAAGRWPAMFLATGDYRTVLEDAAGTVIATDDPVAGATTAPSPGSAGIVIRTLEALTANNSASLDFFGDLDDTYDRYELEFLNLVPQNDDAALFLRIGTGAGPTWQSGASAYVTNAWLLGTASGVFLGGAASAVLLSGNTSTLGVGNVSGEFISGTVEFDNPEAAKSPTFNFRTRYINPTPASIAVVGGGRYATAGAFTGLQLSFNTGNIVSGTARLIGYGKT